MGAADAPSFQSALRDGVRRRDCLALAAVPLAVLAVYALPAPVRQDLAFAYHDPTPVTAFTAHFVHVDAGHLAANLLGYLLLAGPGYVLAVLSGRHRLFGAAAATYVLAFPPVLSVLNLAVPRRAVGYGFSGVNMAFVGLLGLLLVAYTGRCVDGRVRVRHAPGVFFAAVAVIAVLALPDSTTSLAVAAASTLCAATYAVSGWRDWRARRPAREASQSVRASRPAGYLDAGVLAALVFAGYPLVGFPPPAAVEGVVVNRYVHLLGFCLGFIVPYVAVEAGLFDGDSGTAESADATENAGLNGDSDADSSDAVH